MQVPFCLLRFVFVFFSNLSVKIRLYCVINGFLRSQTHIKDYWRALRAQGKCWEKKAICHGRANFARQCINVSLIVLPVSLCPNHFFLFFSAGYLWSTLNFSINPIILFCQTLRRSFTPKRAYREELRIIWPGTKQSCPFFPSWEGSLPNLPDTWCENTILIIRRSASSLSWSPWWADSKTRRTRVRSGVVRHTYHILLQLIAIIFILEKLIACK